jgi:hypothetical protein
MRISRFCITTLLVACTTLSANDNTINALAEQYSQLRARQQTLPQGVFDKELRGSGGQLEKVLDELGKQLGKPKYTQENIIRIMGKPDAIKVTGEFLPPSIDDRAPRAARFRLMKPSCAARQESSSPQKR